jgi:GntR family transcriptional regulator
VTAPVTIEIDPSSPTPPYEQVRSQIESLIISGALPAGTKLPTIRQLANDLGLAANTVARTYRELEAAGLVVTGARSGTSVAPGPPQLAAAQIRERARAAAHRYLTATRALGLSMEDAVATLRSLPPGG